MCVRSWSTQTPRASVGEMMPPTDVEHMTTVARRVEPFDVTFGSLDVFEQRGEVNQDVIVAHVEGAGLFALRKLIEQSGAPHTTKYPTYQPHTTIAYVKPGKGRSFVEKHALDLYGQTARIDALQYRGLDGSVRILPLGRRLNAGFNPDQPREPAGSPGGGQWTSGGGGTPGIDRWTTEVGAVEKALFSEYAIHDKGTRSVLKQEVVQKVGARLAASAVSTEALVSAASWWVPWWEEESTQSREEAAKGLTDTLVHNWAKTSGDNDPLAVVFQDAVQQEFGLAETEREHLGLPSKDAEEYGDVFRAVARAQYEETQELFRTQGITHVTLFRGMSLKQEITAPTYGTVNLQPASSFSLSESTAIDFGEDGIVFAIRVPVDRILSTPRTGMGALPEREVVVLGGSYRAFAVSTGRSNFVQRDLITKDLREGVDGL